MSWKQWKEFGAVLLFSVLSCSLVSEAYISCKNDANEDVDWYLIYKLPDETSKMPSQKKSRTETPAGYGARYVYVDANTPTSAAYWTLSDKSIFEDGNALANTLAPLYIKDERKNLAFAVYNDQPSEGASMSNNGHTKGFFAFDTKTGFWVVHSVPRFPQALREGTYEFPESGRKNGQIILCVTFPVGKVDTIATHLRLQHPFIYDGHAPKAMLKAYPSLALLLRKIFIRKGPWVLSAPLQSVEESTFTSFAKHTKFGKDVYSQWLASKLETHLVASTWRNGRGDKLPSYCEGFTVENVDSTKLAFGEGEDQVVYFRTTKDHSKWAISTVPANPYVCIGSLNRMRSQEKRGGETLCFKNPTVHRLMLNSVDAFEECGNQPGRETGGSRI